MKIESHFVFRTICLLFGLRHSRTNDAHNAGMRIIRNLDIRVGAQVVNARRLVHEVKAEVV